MPGNSKAIKRRITSVKNTYKITKAMELVAASKMRRAVEAAVGTREYAKHAWDILQHVATAQQETTHALLEQRPVHKILMVLVTSNRGLCGGLNANILKKATVLLKNPKTMDSSAADDVAIDVISVGKKGEQQVVKLKTNVVASFVELSDTPRFIEVQPIAQMVLESYSTGEYDKVVIAFSDFVSAINQKPIVRQLLPISPKDLEETIAEMNRLADEPLMQEQQTHSVDTEIVHENLEFIFEPNQTMVLDTILPRLVEAQVYQSVLESSASEHSARMMAMRNASDAAKDMIDDLVFTLNRARQAGITQEIAEISSGMAALS